MRSFDPEILKKLYIPPSDAHKPQNGAVMLIGGSQLFHAASLWSLTVISRIVDMTFYASVNANNEIVQKAKEEFRNGIVVPRNKVDEYIKNADVILIGPGLPREEGLEEGDDDTKKLTEKLLKNYPEKKWVIDGGSLQVIEPELIPHNSILTPHVREFELLRSRIKNQELRIKIEKEDIEEQIKIFAEEYNCVILLKGKDDIVCGPFGSAQDEIRCVRISGGNAGMTKGGTGDVLAGLVAALYSKNDAFLSACAASYINKKAGESLFERVGYYFNASDLADEIPKVLKELL